MTEPTDSQPAVRAPGERTARRKGWERPAFALGLWLLSAAAGCFLWQATSAFGIGVENDAAVYIAGANHWLAGYGISWLSGGLEVHPIVHYPPLMSLLLAGLRVLGMDVLQAGRALSVLSYGLNGLIMGLTLLRSTGSRFLALAGAALVLATPAVFRLHSYAMTDGPYLLLTQIAILLLASYLQTPRAGLLVSAGLAAGLAYLLRYVGVALVLVLALCLMLGLRTTLWRRVKALAVFLVPALAPIGLWFLRNTLLTGRLSDLRTILHGQHSGAFAEGFRLVMDWFLPGMVSERLGAIPGLNGILVVSAGVLALGCGLVLLWERAPRRYRELGPHWLTGIHAVHWLPYMAVLYASAAIAFPPAAIDERTLAPAYLSAVVLLMAGLALAWRRGRLWLRLVVVLVCLGLTYNKAVWTAGIAGRVRNDGWGYTGAAARSSETLAALEALDPGLIYTNNTPMLYIRLGRYAYDLPAEVEVPRADIDPNPESIAAYRARLDSTPGSVVVLFGGADVLPGAEPFAPFTRGLDLVGSYADGAIYRAPEN